MVTHDVEAELVLSVIGSLLADLHVSTRKPVRLETDLTDVGLDSLAIVELHDRLEHDFGVRLSEDVLSTAATPADWLRAILEARGRVAELPIRPAASMAVRRAAGEAWWPKMAQTLTEALSWHVDSHPDLPSISLLSSSVDDSVEELSYRTLASEAATVASGLLNEGLDRYDRVAIMLPTGKAYFVVFLGVLLAGGVPVPIYPPARLSVLEEHLGRQARLLNNAGATVLVTISQAITAGRLMLLHVGSLRSVRTPEALAAAGRHHERLPIVVPDDVALIQYTSGSTGDPKGVVLTHRQLLANIAAMGQAAEVSSSDVFVSWLPLYHDMGLIGAWHASLLFGYPLVVMSPLTFLARPASWLSTISSHSGSLSAAPNFAYQMCVDRISDDDLVGVDLSSWRVAFNGSEPVSPHSLERFIRRFEPYGFHPEAMCPAYGLAEVGVGVAFTPIDRGPRVDSVSRDALQRSGQAIPVQAENQDAISIVGCGTPLPGYEIRVTGSKGDQLPDRLEGAVQCRGPSATAGYFHNEVATRSLWRNGWLDTGDLGYLAGGELFLTGRSKDIVIRGGRNIHPEDIEADLGELMGVCQGGVAVFASRHPDRGTERLIAVIETTLEGPDERSELQSQVARRAVTLIGAAPDEIVLTAPGTLMRTPSGKIRRAATRDSFEAGLLGRSEAPPVLQLLRLFWSGLGQGVRRLRRRMGIWIFASYAWSLVGIIGVPLWLAIHLPSSKRMRWGLTRSAGQLLAALLDVHVQVEGSLQRHLRPAVLVANHPSFVDGLALILASPGPLVFVASTDLERTWIIGSFLRRLGCVFVERGATGQSGEAVARLEAVVRSGRRLAMFPEGSISAAPGMRPFHLGAFVVAASSSCPVIPVGIRGTRDIVRPGTYLPHHADATISIGSPISSTGTDFAASIDLRDSAARVIAKLSERRDDLGQSP